MRSEVLKAILAGFLKFLSYLTILAGLGIVALAILVDYVGLGSEPGFGAKQARLAVFGLVVASAGVITVPPVKHRFLFRWLMPLTPYQCPAQSVPRRMAQIMIVAIWFGLALGFTEGLVGSLIEAQAKLNGVEIIGRRVPLRA